MDIVLVDEVRWMHTEPTLLFKIAKLAGIDPEAIREKTAQRKKTQG